MNVVINQTFTCIVYVNLHDKNDKFHLEKIMTEQVVLQLIELYLWKR